MAWSRSQLSAASRAAYANDKPILFGHNMLTGTTQSAWRTWTITAPAYVDFTAYTTSASNYDAGNSSYPLYRVWDGSSHLQSSAALPGALTNTDRWAALFKFPAATFDSVAIINHNFGSLSNIHGVNGNPANADFYIYAWIGDDDDFTSNVASVYTWKNPTNDKPLVGFNLSDVASVGTEYSSYSGVTNAQVSLVCSGATMTGPPIVGEILFGTRVQLRHQASVPYSDNNLFADASTFAPDFGQFRRYSRSFGGMRFANTYNVTSAGRGDIDTWFSSHISHGIKHFLYVPRPTKAEGGGSVAYPSYNVFSSGEAYWVALEQDSFSLVPVSGPFDYSLELVMKESAPYNEVIT